MKTDVTVVGAGHNGLVAAVALARSGRRVTVFEARPEPGGLCARREIHPGFAVPGVHHDTATLSPTVVAALDLERHGLRLASPPPVLITAAGQGGVLLPGEPAAAAAALDALAPGEGAAYAAWRAFVARVAAPLRRLRERPPLPLPSGGWRDLAALAGPALAFRRLGRATVRELARVAPMSAADWLGERFASPAVAEALAAPALLGTFLGPRSAGSAALVLLRESALEREVAGGPAALVEALLSAARAAGAEIRCGDPVVGIRLAGGRVAGLELGSGEAVDASWIAAACDPKTSLLRLLPPGSLAMEVEEQVVAFRARGTAAKVHLALDGPFEVAARPAEKLSALAVGGGSLDHLERAFDAAKGRRSAPHPYLDVRVPSVLDPSLAPTGGAVVSALVGFAPYHLRQGWGPSERQALGDAVVDALAAVAPTVRQRIVAREVLTPADLETGYGLTGGHLHHGEHALDQLFWMRPIAAAARYATPVPGLFLAGGGSHPGGGVSGLPGLLAARALLAAGR